MKMLQQFPCSEVEFKKTGPPAFQPEVDDLLKMVNEQGISDLFVISHGWNNDMAEARQLYDNFFQRVRGILDSNAVPGAATRKYGIFAILWPSKKFADHELIPSGAAGARSAISVEQLKLQLDSLRGAFDAPDGDTKLQAAKDLAPDLENSRDARKKFGDLMRSLVTPNPADDPDGSKQFAESPGDQLIDRLSKPLPVPPPRTPAGQGGAMAIGVGRGSSSAGGAAGLGSIFSGIISGARNLLNLTTYYQMKERAGTVGRDGVAPLLRQIKTLQPNLRLHLIGHSFGGRLVTAAALGANGAAALPINSMALLQAAFSHYGFSSGYEPGKDGFFRKVLQNKLVSGPVLVTHTVNDRAVGLAYPTASLLANQVASALGDKNSKYGGIGANGAQKTPEATDGPLGVVGTGYTFKGGSVYNLNGDNFITGHSDICKDEVAYALLTAISGT